MNEIFVMRVKAFPKLLTCYCIGYASVTLFPVTACISDGYTILGENVSAPKDDEDVPEMTKRYGRLMGDGLKRRANTGICQFWHALPE
jgi:hypothetical protein